MHPLRLRHDPPMDPVGEVRLPDGGAEEELARLEVVDDVHHLQDDAGDPPVAVGLGRARREQEQLAHVLRLRDGYRDPVPELGAEVLDRLREDRADPALVARVLEVELVQPEEARHLLLRGELEPAPVDDGPAAQQEPERLELPHPHLLERAEGGRAGRVLRFGGHGPVPSGVRS